MDYFIYCIVTNGGWQHPFGTDLDFQFYFNGCALTGYKKLLVFKGHIFIHFEKNIKGQLWILSINIADVSLYSSRNVRRLNIKESTSHNTYQNSLYYTLPGIPSSWLAFPEESWESLKWFWLDCESFMEYIHGFSFFGGLLFVAKNIAVYLQVRAYLTAINQV